MQIKNRLPKLRTKALNEARRIGRQDLADRLERAILKEKEESVSQPVTPFEELEFDDSPFEFVENILETLTVAGEAGAKRADLFQVAPPGAPTPEELWGEVGS